MGKNTERKDTTKETEGTVNRKVLEIRGLTGVPLTNDRVIFLTSGLTGTL